MESEWEKEIRELLESLTRESLDDLLDQMAKFDIFPLLASFNDLSTEFLLDELQVSLEEVIKNFGEPNALE